MANKQFSVLSWNVEHFGRGKNKDQKEARVTRVADKIKSLDPDVMAIYEVEGKELFSEFSKKFNGYSFFITEGRQSQEILVGVRGTINAFVTQKTEFKAGNPFLRPGTLVSLTFNTEVYSILFLHLKSMPVPYGWGLRDHMWGKVKKLKKALNKIVTNPKYIVLGDLNTMGMNYTFGDKDISGEEEIERMEKLVKSKSYNMRLLSKDQPNTFFNGTNGTYPPANLDHVFATNSVQIMQNNNGTDVSVLGWPQEQDKDHWINEFSDHAILYFEVAK
ncbi:MAG: endonuclease/exonuclease/phosphatase family protein [Bacteroidetes bacterium]|nr:endonuclease/exonuclease/phosphatase family protein [Bacteroidota bacterium]